MRKRTVRRITGASYDDRVRPLRRKRKHRRIATDDCRAAGEEQHCHESLAAHAAWDQEKNAQNRRDYTETQKNAGAIVRLGHGRLIRKAND